MRIEMMRRHTGVGVLTDLTLKISKGSTRPF